MDRHKTALEVVLEKIAKRRVIELTEQLTSGAIPSMERYNRICGEIHVYKNIPKMLEEAYLEIERERGKR